MKNKNKKNLGKSYYNPITKRVVESSALKNQKLDFYLFVQNKIALKTFSIGSYFLIIFIDCL